MSPESGAARSTPLAKIVAKFHQLDDRAVKSCPATRSASRAGVTDRRNTALPEEEEKHEKQNKETPRRGKKPRHAEWGEADAACVIGGHFQTFSSCRPFDCRPKTRLARYCRYYRPAQPSGALRRTARTRAAGRLRARGALAWGAWGARCAP